jgi:hypothetical protein
MPEIKYRRNYIIYRLIKFRYIAAVSRWRSSLQLFKDKKCIFLNVQARKNQENNRPLTFSSILGLTGRRPVSPLTILYSEKLPNR